MDEAKIAKSVFGQQDDLGDDLLSAITSGAQENFRKKKANTTKTPRTARDKDKDVLGRRSICTTDRDKNVAITLKSLARAGVKPVDIQVKMLEMDGSLTADSLENLAKIAPNEKELKQKGRDGRPHRGGAARQTTKAAAARVGLAREATRREPNLAHAYEVVRVFEELRGKEAPIAEHRGDGSDHCH